MNSYTKEFITKNKKRRIVAFTILFVLLIVAIALGIVFGSTYISLIDIFKALGNSDDVNNTIITQIRLPRVLGGLLAGIGLAVAGTILQSLMQNDLVSPNTIGISSGAGLVVVVFISLFGNLLSFLPLAAFLGAFLTTMIIYLISAKSGNTKYTIILAGIAIASLFQALMKLVFVFDNDAMVASNDFMIGSLANIRMEQIIPSMIIIVVSLVITLILSSKLNVLALGDDEAKSLGLNVTVYRFIFIVLASLLSSAVIAYAGIIGFVGLMVPHIARRIIGNNHKLVIPFSALMGGVLVIICDLLTRLIFTPYEVPCGILISVLGVPFFLYLLLRRKNHDNN